MKFFVNVSFEAVQARGIIFGVEVDNASHAYSFLYVSDFLFFHTLNNEIVCQRFL